MPPAAAPDWTTPAEVRAQLEPYWRGGRILAARLGGEPLFPLALRLRKPDARALAERFDAVRQWIRGLEEGSKAQRGFGYDIAWTEINHRQLGRNRLPAGVSIASEDDALRLIGRSRQAERFQALADATLARFPQLKEWLARRPLTALDHADDWERILAILAWFSARPRPQLYLRQLDIEGVDTKFIETRKGLLTELFDRVLPPEAVDARFIGARGFEPRYGLTAKPALVRFRLLDPRLALGGLTDLTVPAGEFARLDTAARRVFITENEINGLAFPAMPDSLVIFGLGYGLDRLADATWLATRELHYWGDIDTHGFAILDRLRAAFPQARSLLMDRETLLAHRSLWGREEDRHDGPLTRLTMAEELLFGDLRSDRLGDRVRLEQERIGFGFLTRVLEALAP
jgi:hypothetical protein